MTPQMISTAMKNEINERTVSRSKDFLRFTQTSTDIRVDRMDNIEYLSSHAKESRYFVPTLLSLC